jgi:sporulation protein YlmC with PRC-barrel domain
MNHNRTIAAAVLIGCLIASAGAQTPSAGQGAETVAPAVTVPAGSIQKAENVWRGRTLIGTAVFNDNGQRVATIDDLLITDDGKVDTVVLSVTRRQLVAAPFSQLRFMPGQSIATPRRPAEANPALDPDFGGRRRSVRRSAARCDPA